MVNIKNFVFNPFGENTYVVWDEQGECIVIDPGAYSRGEKQQLAEFIRAEGLGPVMAVCTHGHVDHMLGVQAFKDEFGVPFALHAADGFLIDSAPTHGAIYGFNVGEIPTREIDLSEQDMVQFGNSRLRIIHTPGHTPGHVCLFDEAGKQLFTGDTMFRESIGRTDLPGGDYSWIMRSILDKILPLGGDVEIFTGHGPKSSISHEVLYNPFITEVIGGEVSY
jgi:glyoxylase-like metal-dependent hydrolase (beta-lactamase superfamily II)